jgi:hypothetical protein
MPPCVLLVPCRCSEPFATLELLGLSINGCPGSALDLSSGQKLLLSNTHLKGSNAKELAEDGGAALLKEIKEVSCIERYCQAVWLDALLLLAMHTKAPAMSLATQQMPIQPKVREHPALVRMSNEYMLILS